MLVPVTEYYGSNIYLTSWVGSILLGMFQMVGPIAGHLVNEYGCQAVGVTGSLLAALCIGMSTFSPNVPALMVTYGLLGGISIGLIYLPAVANIGFHFKVNTEQKLNDSHKL